MMSSQQVLSVIEPHAWQGRPRLNEVLCVVVYRKVSDEGAWASQTLDGRASKFGSKTSQLRSLLAICHGTDISCEVLM